MQNLSKNFFHINTKLIKKKLKNNDGEYQEKFFDKENKFYYDVKVIYDSKIKTIIANYTINNNENNAFEDYFGNIHSKELNPNGFGKYSLIAELHNLYSLGYFDSSIRYKQTISFTLGSKSKLNNIFNGINLVNIEKQSENDNNVQKQLLSQEFNKKKSILKNEVIEETQETNDNTLTIFIGEIDQQESSNNSNIQSPKTKGNYLVCWIEESNQIISSIENLLTDLKLTDKSDLNVFNTEKNFVINKLNLNCSDFNQTNYKFFYGNLIETKNQHSVQSGYLFMNNPSEGRVIYKGNLSNSFFQDSNAIYYKVDKKQLYKGEFKNNTFLKGIIIHNIDANSDKRDFQIYEYDSEMHEKAEYKRVYELDSLDEYWKVISMGSTDMNFSLTLEAIEEHITTNYNSFELMFDVVFKSIILMFYSKKNQILFNDIHNSKECLKNFNELEDLFLKFHNFCTSTIENVLYFNIEEDKIRRKLTCESIKTS